MDTITFIVRSLPSSSTFAAGPVRRSLGAPLARDHALTFDGFTAKRKAQTVKRHPTVIVSIVAIYLSIQFTRRLQNCFGCARSISITR